MADVGAAAIPAKYTFGQLARRSMTDRTVGTRPADPAPSASEVAAAFDQRADELRELFTKRADITEFDDGTTRDDAEKADRLLRPLAPRG